MPKSGAERQRQYRDKKRAAAKKTTTPAMSVAERVRKSRARKKTLHASNVNLTQSNADQLPYLVAPRTSIPSKSVRHHQNAYILDSNVPLSAQSDTVDVADNYPGPSNANDPSTCSVKLLGTEEASKNMPSRLSIAVWQLLRTVQKNDSEGGEGSDETSQDIEGSNDIDAILEKLPKPSNQPEASDVMEIKIEPTWDGFEEETIVPDNINSVQKPVEVLVRRRKSTCIDNGETIKTVEKKKMRMETSADRSHEDSGTKTSICKEEIEINEDVETSINPEDISNCESPVDHAVWMIEAAQREHELKLRTLNTELERAELQKQAAINELKTSEMKKKMMEAQAEEYYSQLRMNQQGDPGSGAGRGGGGGGSIRSAGGSFGKMEAAHEDQYFYNQQKEQLEHLREGLHDEISFHEEQIKRHQEAINRHKERIGKMVKE